MTVETINGKTYYYASDADGRLFFSEEACLDYEEREYLQSFYENLPRVPFLNFEDACKCCDIHISQNYLILNSDEDVENIKRWVNKVINNKDGVYIFEKTTPSYPIIAYISIYSGYETCEDEAYLKFYSIEEFKNEWNKLIVAINAGLEELK